MVTYGSYLKQFSINTGIQQKQVAAKLGYSQQRVNNYFRDISEPPFDFIEKFKAQFGVDLRVEITRRSKSPVNLESCIPVFDFDSNDLSENFLNCSDKALYFVQIPFFSDCNAAIRISTNSMIPVYVPNDILFIKKISNLDVIPYGEPFLIITKEQKLIRYLRKYEGNENAILLKSENKQMDDIICRLEDIKFVFLIKGHISRR